MPSLLTLLLPLPVALALALATTAVSRRLAWLGAIAVALGVASVRVALRLPLTGTADPLWVAALPPVSLRIDAGFQLLGALLVLGSAIWSLVRGGTPRDRASSVLALVAVCGVIAAAIPLFAVAGWIPTLGAAVALGLGIGAAGGALAWAANRLRCPPAAGAPRESLAMSPLSVRWRLLLLLGAAAALGAPHLDLVLAGAAVAAIAAHAGRTRKGPAALPAFPALVIGALGFAGYYLHVIAGPGAGWLASLPDAPLSAAAQAFLVPALAVAAAGFFGFWPLGALTPGPWLAPLGVAILLRVGVASLPLGIEGWRTVMIPLGVAALFGAALTRRPLLLPSAAAWMACFAPAGGGAAGAWILALVPTVSAAWRPARAAPWVAGGSVLRAGALTLAGALGGVLALDGLLRAEVVYAALSVAAVAFSAVYISRADP